jgi:hypothetical protein
MATIFTYPSASISTGPVQFNLNGSATIVSKDTVTPANSRPLPVEITGASGPINITAGDLSVQLTDTGANPDIVKIGDGTNRLVITAGGAATVSAASLPLPSGASTETTLSALNAKVTAVNTGAVVVSSSALPSGAATSAKQPALGVAGTPSTDVLTVQGAVAMTALKVDGSAVTQPVSGTVTVSQATATSLNATVVQPTAANLNATVVQNTAANLNATVVQSTAANLNATVVQSVAANLNATVSQAGTWNITNVSGTVSLPTGAATAAKQPALGVAGTPSTDVLTVQGAATMTALKVDGSAVTQPVSIAASMPAVNGRAYVTSVRNDYTTTNVTTGAWVQLIASTPAATKELYIFDSSGQTLELGTGAAASETRVSIIVPGGQGTVPLAISTATRVSVRAVSGY